MKPTNEELRAAIETGARAIDQCRNWDQKPAVILRAPRFTAEERAALEWWFSSDHLSGCILSRFECGEPIPGGGYRQKFAGKWYAQTPPCDCGLDSAAVIIRAMLDDEKGGT